MFRLAKFAYWLLHLLIFVCFLMIVTSALYFVHGSLEDFPTEEDHAKACMFSTFLFNLFLLLELIFLRIRSGLKRIITTQNMPGQKRLLFFVLEILLMIMVPVLLLYLIFHFFHIFALNSLLGHNSSVYRYLGITAVYLFCIFVTLFFLKKLFQKR